ncbi:fatty acid desaturase [Robiginitomaculum antarcticum]|uniref:fatty acid desaturase n=1 Tax=Robiginitomaculum antarcticum TaxID=437507 RepID=UPI001F35EA3C|nr:fatty acid desaturase [Robiginitomaculum antarcticum]
MSHTTHIPTYWPGLVLAGLVCGGWLALHIFLIFGFDWRAAHPLFNISAIALQVWLYAGMFIVAHDSMHGSLFPHHPKANHGVGQAILLVYAGFHWPKMRRAHHAHHDNPGTADDPDFNADNPHNFAPWFLRWFLTYFGWAQMAIITAMALIYMLVFGAAYSNILLFWALPALLSALQLFYFGTYLPHRHGEAFADHHNARSNDYNWLGSLLSCFHFGYHHEHHLYPYEPWWRLPRRRAETRKAHTK